MGGRSRKEFNAKRLKKKVVNAVTYFYYSELDLSEASCFPTYAFLFLNYIMSNQLKG